MPKWYEFNNHDRVRVARRDDEFCKSKYMGHVGEISEISYGASEWPVGESREDPYATVKFADGQRNGFWLTELDLVSKDTPLTTPIAPPISDDELLLLETQVEKLLDDKGPRLDDDRPAMVVPDPDGVHPKRDWES